jgi:biotin-(acetyl-CoA carboxylase) ligase
MAWKQLSRTVERHVRSLDLPPPFRLVALREAGDAYAHACARADELGAGTIVVVGRFDLAEFAVILEPEEPLAAARRAFYAGMVALGDAISAMAPPEKPILIHWPDALWIDEGLVGGGRLGWPAAADEKARPDWLVFAGTIRTAFMAGDEPGLRPSATALEEEGFEDAGSARVIEGFCRHFMAAIDRWQEAGFEQIAKRYRANLKLERGAFAKIEENGDLVIGRAGRADRRQALLPALASPSWFDPASGEPRL